jgi:hypothetical protein
MRRTTPILLASTSLLVLTCALQASTGCFGGLLEWTKPVNKRGPRDPRLLHLGVRTDFVWYQSNNKHVVGELNDTYDLKKTTTPAIGGWLTSVEAFQQAIPHFKKRPIWCYEDTHFDLWPGPDYEFGLLREIDQEAGTLTLDVQQCQASIHFGENPVVSKTIEISKDARFLLEPWKDMPRDRAANKLGWWVQVHPPRKQMVWVESDAGRWKPGHLPGSRENRHRDIANSLTNNAVFEGWTVVKYRRRHSLGMVLTTWQDTDKDGWPVYKNRTSDVKEKKLGDGRVRVVRSRRTHGAYVNGTVLDGKWSPAWVAQKPGRHVAACHYRKERFPHERYFRTRDDERRGTIVSVDGRSVTVDVTHWNGRSERVEFDTDAEASVFIDGRKQQDLSNLERGQFVRIFPERRTQSVVFLDRHRPFIETDRKKKAARTGQIYHPNAYFHASELAVNGKAKIRFDARYSHHPTGRKIVKYEWRFGDGTKASGPQVSKAFTPDQPYERIPVRLTVTDEQGLSDTWIEVVEITDGQLKARKVDEDKLQPGLVNEVWSKGKYDPKLRDLSFADKPGDRHVGVSNWPNVEGRHFGKSSMKRTTAWFYVGASGLHEMRCAGPPHAAYLFLLDGVRMIDSRTAVPYGLGGGPPENLHLRARVFLEKGWHRYEVYYDKFKMKMHWNGPGVTCKNMRNDVAPVFHLPAEAHGAAKTLWLKGAASSSGRPLVTKDGKAPKRKGPSSKVIHKSLPTR